MPTREEIEVELKKMLDKEYDENFCCINNDSGMCLWQRNRGEECNKICERYNQCFSCTHAGQCKRIAESMVCNLDHTILSDSYKI